MRRASCTPDCLPGCALLVVYLSACGGGVLAPGSDAGDGGSPAGGDAGTAGRGGRAACTFRGFASPVVYTPAASPSALVAADLTHDGRPDLLIVESHDGATSLELLSSNGGGTFSLSALPVAINPNALVAADFDGDGVVDLASQSNGATGIDLATDDGVLAFDFGTGQGTLSSQAVTLATPQTSGRLAVGDFDGDGRPDLAFAGYDYVMTGPSVSAGGGLSLPGPEPTNEALDVFHNAGQGSFAAPASYANPASFGDLVAGDFDGDGHLDIAELSSTTAGLIGVFYNAGDGTFRDEAPFAPAPEWAGFGLAVADFNGDGIDDLATTTILHPNATNEAIVLEVFTGAHDGSFAVAITDLTAVPDVCQVVTGDFNGDGKPDVALVLTPAGRGGGSPPVPVAIFANQGDGTFAPPVIYPLSGGASEPLTNAITAGDFNGDGVSDLAVATTGRFAPYPVAVHLLLSQCE